MRSFQAVSRAQGNSGRQPSRRATGANASSNALRAPLSAPMWLTSTISPPGLSTRANSSSVASGSGTAVMTYCATITSNESSGNARCLASITASASTLLKPNVSTRSFALRSIGAEMSMPTRRFERA